MRPLVRVTVNDYSYRSTVGSMDGQPIISFSRSHRQASGIQGGGQVSVTLSIDPEPRTVQIPDDLQAALEAADVMEAFQSIGRQAELVGLAAKGRQADCRVLTLLGPGGTGKTRLAKARNRPRPRYPVGDRHVADHPGLITE